MVKRYPHTAILKLRESGELIDGEWSEGNEIEIELHGRLEVASGKRIVRNASGNEVAVSYEFFCKKFTYNGSPVSLTVMGIEKSVIDIEKLQSHYMITL